MKTPDQGRTMDVPTTIRGLGGFGDVQVDQFPVGADGALSSPVPPPEFLLARSRAERRVCPEFVVDFPVPWTFAVDVRQVCPEARLELSIDGALVQAVDLPAEDVPGKTSTLDPTYDLWVCEYDEEFAIEVPAGRHAIRVENAASNGSWVQVQGYRFLRHEPVSLAVLGLTGRTSVLLWVRNRESVWYRWDRPPAKAVTGAKVSVRGLPNGRWRVEWLDTWRGGAIRTDSVAARNGSVALHVPPVERDIACRLLRQ